MVTLSALIVRYHETSRLALAILEDEGHNRRREKTLYNLSFFPQVFSIPNVEGFGQLQVRLVFRHQTLYCQATVFEDEYSEYSQNFSILEFPCRHRRFHILFIRSLSLPNISSCCQNITLKTISGNLNAIFKLRRAERAFVWASHISEIYFALKNSCFGIVSINVERPALIFTIRVFFRLQIRRCVRHPGRTFSYSCAWGPERT